ncbi:MAG: RNA polymerase-binding protein DksA [Desulfuromonas sp.]|nr:MAG: RNA polymerase-binding protein DksA [Desulfuromonas sp.]
MDELSTCYRPHSGELYMSTRQRHFFRERLLTWRLQLQEENRRISGRIRSEENSGGDLIDQVVADNSKARDFLSRSRNEALIRQIDAALERIAEGSYGYCLESGEEIGVERLMAHPAATLSVEAQQERENRSRQHNYGRVCYC